jgi:hypothetical protein
MRPGNSNMTARLLGSAALVLAGVVPIAAPAQPAGIDPQAVKLLKASTDYLASLKQYGVDARTSIEVVLNTGQKLQFDAAASLALQRPNKLRGERRGRLVDQIFYYDGKSLTLYNPGQRYYATVAAPDTLEAMLDFARTKLDIEAPAGDLLYGNAFDIVMDGVTSGFVVGKGVIEGVRCDHLAFRGAVVDWQIWIQEGGRPLPRKYLITSREVAGAPEFSVVMIKWNLTPKFSDSMFTFTPPKGAKKVDFLPLEKGELHSR